MEIERKFLLNKLPDNLSDYPHHDIEQAYLCRNPVVRIRRQDDDYILTYKGGGKMIREEYNLPGFPYPRIFRRFRSIYPCLRRFLF